MQLEPRIPVSDSSRLISGNTLLTASLEIANARRLLSFQGPQATRFSRLSIRLAGFAEGVC